MKTIIQSITVLCIGIAAWQTTWFCVGLLAGHMTRLHGIPLESTVIFAQVVVFGFLGVVGLLVLAYLGRRE